MQWRAFYYLQLGEDSNEEGNNSDESYEKSRFSTLFSIGAKPPVIAQMEFFEKDLLEIPKKLEFRAYTNQFQREMKENLNKMTTENPNKVIVPADKTRNYYACPIENYEKILTECITNEHRLANESELDEVNQKAALIARKEKLETRMEVYTPGKASITVKDTKLGFPERLSCRLLNPAKTHIGKLSQTILKEKVAELRYKLLLNHWKSTHEVLEWLKIPGQ